MPSGGSKKFSRISSLCLFFLVIINSILDPAVQSIVSLTSLLVVKMLTLLVSTVANSKVFLLKNMSSFCKSYSHFFSKNISLYAIFNEHILTIR